MKKLIFTLFTILSIQFSQAQTVLDVVVASDDHLTLQSAIVAAGLNGTLSGPGPFTLFAPTDDAFGLLDPQMLADLFSDPSGILSDYLKYHIHSGELAEADLFDGQVLTMFDGNTAEITVNTMTLINDATLTGPDIFATNGIVHIIDVVLIPPVNANTVVDIIVDSPVHNTLETAIIAAELDDDLATAGPFTVFAPTDAAFDALPPGVLDALLMNPTTELADVLLYHVLGDNVLAADIVNGLTSTPLNDANTLKFTITTGSSVFANQAEVTMTNLIADNGVVHIIDAVVLPSETVVDVAIDNGFVVLTAAINGAELIPALSDPFAEYTVFAPTDAAFSALPPDLLTDLLNDPTGELRDILLYHVLGSEVPSGSITNGLITDPLNNENTVKLTLTSANEVFINQAQVSLPDVTADNGIVHVIDAVILPSETVVDIAIDNGFTTLTSAVVAAELVPPLSDPFGTLTVFAPTDDAFADLPDGTLDALLTDPTGDLADILLYHVAGSVALSSDLSDGQVIETLLGEDLAVSIDGMVMINSSTVTLPDLESDNGVVHVINMVLLPPTSILELSDLNISVFPNPTADFIQINSNSQIQNFEIFDLNGSLIFSQSQVQNDRIDLSDLASGLYEIRVLVDGSIGTAKLLKK